MGRGDAALERRRGRASGLRRVLRPGRVSVPSCRSRRRCLRCSVSPRPRGLGGCLAAGRDRQRGVTGEDGAYRPGPVLRGPGRWSAGGRREWIRCTFCSASAVPTRKVVEYVTIGSYGRAVSSRWIGRVSETPRPGRPGGAGPAFGRYRRMLAMFFSRGSDPEVARWASRSRRRSPHSAPGVMVVLPGVVGHRQDKPPGQEPGVGNTLNGSGSPTPLERCLVHGIADRGVLDAELWSAGSCRGTRTCRPHAVDDGGLHQVTARTPLGSAATSGSGCRCPGPAETEPEPEPIGP